MKKKFILNAFIVGLIILLPLTATFAAVIKIGVIDTQKIMRESKAAKKARAVFLKDVEAKRKVLNAKQQEVKGMEDELREKGKDMAPQVRKEKADNLNQEIKELRRLKSDLEEELKKKEMELNRKIFLEIADIVREYLKKEKYTIILEKRSVIASDDTIDITDKILRLYDVIK